MPKDSYASGPSSNPSSKSYSGGGGGGVSSGKTTGGSIGGGNKGGGLGVTTGKTIHGNTAYGPAGGMATGYATAKLGGNAGMGPSVNTYSNFRNLDGSAAIPGAGNMPAMGRNPQQARSVLERQFAPAGRPRVGGLLDGEQVAVGPIPAPRRIVPTAMSIPPIPRMRPPGLTADAVWNNFKSWWSDPVSVKYSNPFSPDNLVRGSTMFKNNMGDFGGLGNMSTQYKNNMGDFGGLGNMSTQYKNAPGSTFGKNNMGQ